MIKFEKNIKIWGKFKKILKNHEKFRKYIKKSKNRKIHFFHYQIVQYNITDIYLNITDISVNSFLQ